MCGDGANDAPALRQAQMGIAVFSATDVAKSAAGIVLTAPGLGCIVAAVLEGRTTFQRILTYTFRSIIHKVVQVLFLLAGLIISHAAVLTPLLMVLMMVAGDFFALSSATDNVRASPVPNAWLLASSVLDIALFSTLATQGILMTPLAASIVACVFGAAIVLALFLDTVKILLFRRLAIALSLIHI